MFEDKVQAALHFISQDTKGRVLSLDDLVQMGVDEDNKPLYQTAFSILKLKNPSGKPAHPDVLLPLTYNEDSMHDSILLEQRTWESIKQAASCTMEGKGRKELFRLSQNTVLWFIS